MWQVRGVTVAKKAFMPFMRLMLTDALSASVMESPRNVLQPILVWNYFNILKDGKSQT